MAVTNRLWDRMLIVDCGGTLTGMDALWAEWWGSTACSDFLALPA